MVGSSPALNIHLLAVTVEEDYLCLRSLHLKKLHMEPFRFGADAIVSGDRLRRVAPGRGRVTLSAPGLGIPST